MNYAECGNCGWIGPITELDEHPTRPMPMDLGFCPECACEIDNILTEEEATRLLEEYGD